LNTREILNVHRCRFVSTYGILQLEYGIWGSPMEYEGLSSYGIWGHVWNPDAPNIELRNHAFGGINMHLSS
jgi:hypothetical protein